MLQRASPTREGELALPSLPHSHLVITIVFPNYQMRGKDGPARSVNVPAFYSIFQTERGWEVWEVWARMGHRHAWVVAVLFAEWGMGTGGDRELNRKLETP